MTIKFSDFVIFNMVYLSPYHVNALFLTRYRSF